MNTTNKPEETKMTKADNSTVVDDGFGNIYWTDEVVDQASKIVYFFCGIIVE